MIGLLLAYYNFAYAQLNPLIDKETEMMSIKYFKGMLIVGALGFAANASALDMGYDVTIYDGAGAQGEDGEVEPNMLNAQRWDMEGFHFNYTTDTLTMVGGFDLINGVYDGHQGKTYTAGDIFLSTSTPVYGDIDGNGGMEVVDNTYGYDMVLDIDYSAGSWELLSLDETAQVITADLPSNEGSSPFQYQSGGVATGISGTFDLSTATDAETGYEGGTHYVLSLDLSDLIKQTANDTVFYAHFTQGCGNDNLMGSWQVPEPTTYALFMMGIAGLWFSRRKQNSAKSNNLSV